MDIFRRPRERCGLRANQPGTKLVQKPTKETDSEVWYGQVTIQNLALRPALTRDELRRSLAIKCGATKATPAHSDFS